MFEFDRSVLKVRRQPRYGPHGESLKMLLKWFYGHLRLPGASSARSISKSFQNAFRRLKNSTQFSNLASDISPESRCYYDFSKASLSFPSLSLLSVDDDASPENPSKFADIPLKSFPVAGIILKASLYAS